MVKNTQLVATNTAGESLQMLSRRLQRWSRVWQPLRSAVTHVSVDFNRTTKSEFKCPR